MNIDPTWICRHGTCVDAYRFPNSFSQAPLVRGDASFSVKQGLLAEPPLSLPLRGWPCETGLLPIPSVGPFYTCSDLPWDTQPLIILTCRPSQKICY